MNDEPTTTDLRGVWPVKAKGRVIEKKVLLKREEMTTPSLPLGQIRSPSSGGEDVWSVKSKRKKRESYSIREFPTVRGRGTAAISRRERGNAGIPWKRW